MGPARRSGVTLLAVWILAAASAALGGASVEHLYSDEALLGDWRYDVYAVRVTAVDDAPATNAAPPRVRLRILEAMRGEAEPGTEILAVWSPPPHAFDVSGPESRARLEAWRSRPVAPPEVGEAYVVLGLDPVERLPTFRVSPRCRYRDQAETRRHVRRLIRDGWRERRRESAIRSEAKRRAARAAEHADRTRQAGADVRALAREATDVAMGRWTAMIPFEDGWLLEFFDARSLKRPDATLDPDDRTGTLYVWTDRDLAEIYSVRRLQGFMIVFLDPWPESGDRVRNAHRLVGGEWGVLAATAERRSEVTHSAP